jgi:glutathionylspermidine synthase
MRVREIAPADAREIRLRLVLDHCKWDPQVGDQNTLPPYALVMDRSAWLDLAAHTEALARELADVEQVLGERRDFDDVLGVPRALCDMIRGPLAPTPTLARVVRFDFHPTRTGWALSEINADVPGGFTEASYLPRLVGEALGLEASGNPTRAFVDAMVSRVGEGEAVGLICAPGFMEDAQVVAFLARELEARERRATLGNATTLTWTNGHARSRGAAIAGIVRFYQAEWIAEMREARDLVPLFRGGKTPVTNPAGATIAESKRLPLVLESLNAPTLLAAFPRTCWCLRDRRRRRRRVCARVA